MGMIKTSYGLFFQAVNDNAFPEIFSFDYFVNLCGMFELNDYSIMIEPSLKSDLESLFVDRDFKGKKRFITQVKSFMKKVQKQEGLFALSIGPSDNEIFEAFVEYVPLIEGNGTWAFIHSVNLILE